MVFSVVLTSFIAGYFYVNFLSLHFICLFPLSLISKIYPNLATTVSASVSVVVNVRFTTNGMCVKNNTHVLRTSTNKMSTTWDLFAWCDSGKLCALAARPFQSQQSGALTRM